MGTFLLAIPNLLSGPGIPVGILSYMIVIGLCASTPMLILDAWSLVYEIHEETERIEDNDENGDGILSTNNESIENNNAEIPLMSYACDYDHEQSLSHLDGTETNIENICLNIKAMRVLPSEIHTYEDLVKVVLGDFAGKTIYGAVLLLSISWVITLTISIQDILKDMTMEDEVMRRSIVGVALFILFGILGQIPSLGDMWQINAFSIFILIFGVIGGALYTAIFEDSNEEPSDGWEFRWDNMVAFMGSSLYAVENVAMTMPTRESMADPKKANLVCVASILSFGFLSILYATVAYLGGVGGLSVDDECNMVINCVSPPELKMAVKYPLIVSMVLYYPLVVFPAIEMLESNLNNSPTAVQETGLKDEDSTEQLSGYEKPNRKLRLFVALISVVAGSTMTNFAAVGSIVGSIVTTYAGFVLPVILYVRVTQKAGRKISWKSSFLLTLLLAFALAMMVSGVGTALMNLIN